MPETPLYSPVLHMVVLGPFFPRNSLPVTVDQMGVDEMGVDKMGVDETGVDEMGT